MAEALDAPSIRPRVEALLERGNGADRMRAVYADRQSFDDVVEWLIRETRLGTGVDRRRSQRANG